MPDFARLMIIVGAGIGAFALLLLIISVGTPGWLDDGLGDTVGLFRQCYSDTAANTYPGIASGCTGANRITQGGLSVFGILLLSFAVITAIAGYFMQRNIILFISLGLFYFASMFVMGAYATWGVYARDEASYFYPVPNPPSTPHTQLGYSYNLCVAAHYFLWTALTMVAFGIGHVFSGDRNTPTH